MPLKCTVLLRRLKCFHHFIGTTGRTKNLSVFYCFIRWEGCSTTHNTRRLRSGGRSSSAGETKALPASEVPSKGVFNGKETKQLQALAQLFSSPTSKSSASSISTPEENNVQAAKKRMLEEETRSVRAAKIQSARTSIMFDALSEGQKEAMISAWYETIMDK